MDSVERDTAQPWTWFDAFPWLRSVSLSPGAIAAFGWERPVDEGCPEDHQERIERVSELAMQRLSRWSIGQIFPGLPQELMLHSLELPTRAANALAERHLRKASDIFSLTPEEILQWPWVGVGTVDGLLQQLADAATLHSNELTPANNAQQSLSTTFGNAWGLPDKLASIVDDLIEIAAWQAMIGRASERLDRTPPITGTPLAVIEARDRLNSLTPQDVLNEVQADRDAASVFNDGLVTLGHRAVQILAKRLFADDPTTLDQLGIELGVTRERVRQLEAKARAAMFSLLTEGGDLEKVATSARELIGTVRPLSDLLIIMPALMRTVELAGQPAWRVIDRLDDAYEIEDGWCVAPTLQAAQEVTHTQLQERADRYGVVTVGDLDLVQSSDPDALPDVTKQWLTACGYIIDGELVLTRTRSVGDYAAAVLSISGTPLTSQEIIDRFAFERHAGTLRNAMSLDERFERVDRDRWALTEWGMDAYAGIRTKIREQVAQSGGRVKLNELIEFITGRYSVSASSVAAYASAPPFEMRDGIVQLAGANRNIRKTPERTRRLFRCAQGWAYRVRISVDHLRGSGSVAPIAVASILGLQYGETRQLSTTLGPQAIAWTGSQPQFGTIRRFLMACDVEAGTDAFLVIGDDGSFAFEPARELKGDPLQDALSLAGASATTDAQEACGLLAAAVGLSQTTPVTSIIAAYRERGDSDIADLLIEVRAQLEVAHSPERVTHRADVDDILDLL